MVEKAQPLTFGPAPRPTRRLSQEQANQLSAETADLGFGRGTSTAPAEMVPEPARAPLQVREAAPATPANPMAKSRPAIAAARPKAAKMAGSASLKFELPADLWTALKVEAAERRVTVKYLVLEALSKQGFVVDLNSIPEDGRRIR